MNGHIPEVIEAAMRARITADDARWMLGYYDMAGGEKPGGFTTALITAISKADPGNRRRLAMGFPGLVAAFDTRENVGGLQTIADSDRTTEPAYQCPHCGVVSHHPTDKKERYCAACHRFADSDVVMVDEGAVTDLT